MQLVYANRSGHASALSAYFSDYRLKTVFFCAWPQASRPHRQKARAFGKNVPERLKSLSMTIHILALETSSSLCGVALLSSGDAQPVLRIRVDSLLREAGIDRAQLGAVAFGQGPGGFTGLRVACGVAQGIGFALGIPVIEVSSLLAVAARDRDAAGLKVVVQDARMGEVYLAAYLRAESGSVDDRWVTVQEPLLLGMDDVEVWLDREIAPRGQACRLVGDALEAYPPLAQLAQARPWLEIGPGLRADAATVAALALQKWCEGGVIRPDHAAPLYVRDKVAFTTAERERGAGGNPRASAAAPVAVSAAASCQERAREEGAPEVVLDAMRDEHLDAVAEIEGSVQSHPWTRGNFADGLKAGYSGWVARRQGQVVGFAMLMLAPDVAHLLVIAVHRTEQGRGVGARLLRRCEQEAAARGLPAVMLEVRPSNGNALRFYRERGYRVIATRKDYYPAGHGRREDAYLMEKRMVEADEAQGAGARGLR
jgi:tRNA threonylcarbamoyladenosine biosynthesis protein TsaB